MLDILRQRIIANGTGRRVIPRSVDKKRRAVNVVRLDKLVGRRVLGADVVIGGEESEFLREKVNAPFPELRLVGIAHERPVLAAACEVETRVVAVAFGDLVEQRAVVIAGRRATETHGLARKRIVGRAVSAEAHGVESHVFVLRLPGQLLGVVGPSEFADGLKGRKVCESLHAFDGVTFPGRRYRRSIEEWIIDAVVAVEVVVKIAALSEKRPHFTELARKRRRRYRLLIQIDV